MENTKLSHRNVANNKRKIPKRVSQNGTLTQSKANK